MQKEKDWQIHNVNGELVKSTLVVIFRFKRTSAISSSWYLEEEDTTDFMDYRKGY